MLDAVIPVFSEQINSQAVGLRIDDLEQAIAHSDELPGIDETLEDGVLHALAVIEACLGGLAKPSASGRRNSGDIVSDQDLHEQTAIKALSSFPDKGGIGVEIAAEVTREQARLKMRHDSPRHFLEKKWVDDFLAFSFLPGNENFLARILAQRNGSAFAPVKIRAVKLVTIEKGEREAISQNGPEFFHQIESEGRTAGPIAVQKTDRRIESGGGESRAAIMREQSIEK